MTDITSSTSVYPHDQETTERVAEAMGRLRKFAKEVTRRSIDRKLYVELGKRNVGTWEIESKNLPKLERWGMGMEGGERRKKGDKKIEMIREHRDAKVIREILEVKAKAIAREEKRARRNYVREKRDLETLFRDRGKQKPFKRLIKKIGRGTTVLWEKGRRKIREKVEWCTKKFIKVTSTKEDEWVSRMADGSGRQRQRVETTVPVYEVGLTLDSDETSCLKLPIKHALYPKVSIEGTMVQQEVADANLRMDRKDRDFDPHTREEVTVEEPVKSKEELIEAQISV